jgi:hypothetical protein
VKWFSAEKRYGFLVLTRRRGFLRPLLRGRGQRVQEPRGVREGTLRGRVPGRERREDDERPQERMTGYSPYCLEDVFSEVRHI